MKTYYVPLSSVEVLKLQPREPCVVVFVDDSPSSAPVRAGQFKNSLFPECLKVQIIGEDGPPAVGRSHPVED